MSTYYNRNRNTDIVIVTARTVTITALIVTTGSATTITNVTLTDVITQSCATIVTATVTAVIVTTRTATTVLFWNTRYVTPRASEQILKRIYEEYRS